MIGKNEVNDMKRYLPLLLTLALTGCAQTTTGAQEVAQETPVEAQDNVQEVQEAQETEANDPDAAEMVSRGFLLASDYGRMLTVNGSTDVIKGSYRAGNNYYAKSLRACLTNMSEVNGNGGYHLDGMAEPMDLKPADLLWADDFTGLKVGGNTVTGTLKAGVLTDNSVPVTITFNSGVVEKMEGEGIKMETDLDSFPTDWLSDDDTFTYYYGSDDMLKTTRDHAYDFSSLGEDEILRLGKEYGRVSDGLVFHLTYDIYMNGYDEEIGGGVSRPAYVDTDTLTLNDIHVSPMLRYGDVKGYTLGDIGLEMKALSEYQLKQDPSAENKRRASDKWYKSGAGTYGLPRWYHDLVFGEME